MSRTISTIVALASLIIYANAETYVVDVLGGGDFTTIQDAIDGASDGDMILVNSDIHHLNTSIDGVITVDKELIIQGHGYDLPASGGTTIRSNGAIFTFSAAADGSILRGFRLKGNGNPLITLSAAEVIIEDNLFMNTYSSAYSISLDAAAVTDTIRNNIFSAGEGGNSSGGIHAVSTNGLVINNNLFAGLSLSPIFVSHGNVNDKIINNVFVSNTASNSIQLGWQGNISQYAYIAGNIFMNNVYGILNNASTPTTINNCFYNNTSNGSIGLEELTQDPVFVNYSSGDDYDEESYDTDNYDFHLNTSSPAIDAGPPDPEFRDLDGSLNDMGMYGWLYPTGTTGAPPIPLINQISVTPTGVAPGETISIEIMGRFGE